MQASTHYINKFSPLIIYLDFEATMTTHKLTKKQRYRQSCLISGCFGLRPFSEIINAGNDGGGHSPQGESKDLNQLASLRAVRLEHYASHFLR